MHRHVDKPGWRYSGHDFSPPPFLQEGGTTCRFVSRPSLCFPGSDRGGPCSCPCRPWRPDGQRDLVPRSRTPVHSQDQRAPALPLLGCQQPHRPGGASVQEPLNPRRLLGRPRRDDPSRGEHDRGRTPGHGQSVGSRLTASRSLGRGVPRSAIWRLRMIGRKRLRRSAPAGGPRRRGAEPRTGRSRTRCAPLLGAATYMWCPRRMIGQIRYRTLVRVPVPLANSSGVGGATTSVSTTAPPARTGCTSRHCPSAGPPQNRTLTTLPRRPAP